MNGPDRLRLLERAVTASTNSIVITDPNLPDDPLVYVNPAFERTTWYAAEEVLGRNCRFLQDEDRRQSALEELSTAVHEGRECTVVLSNYRKDGALFSAMHERVAGLGGNIEIASRPGEGTRVAVRVPLGDGTPTPRRL